MKKDMLPWGENVKMSSRICGAHQLGQVSVTLVCVTYGIMTGWYFNKSPCFVMIQYYYKCISVWHLQIQKLCIHLPNMLQSCIYHCTIFLGGHHLHSDHQVVHFRSKSFSRSTALTLFK